MSGSDKNELLLLPRDGECSDCKLNCFCFKGFRAVSNKRVLGSFKVVLCEKKLFWSYQGG